MCCLKEWYTVGESRFSIVRLGAVLTLPTGRPTKTICKFFVVRNVEWVLETDTILLRIS